MVRWLTGIIAAVAASTQPALPHEASMNFDTAQVRPFLARLKAKLLPDLDVDKLARFISATQVEQERATRITVHIDGRAEAIEVRVFMDDIDAPDLAFRTASPELAEAIDRQMEAFAEEQGI